MGTHKITRQLWFGFVLATGLNQPLLGLTLFLMMIALYNQRKWKQPHQHPLRRSPDLGEWQEAFKAKALEKSMAPITSPGHWWRLVSVQSKRNRCRCTSKEKEGRWQKATQDQKSESSCLSPHQPLRNWMLWRNVTNPLVSENFYSGWEEGKRKRSSWFHQSIRWHFGKMFPSNSVFVSFRDFWSDYWSLPLF